MDNIDISILVLLELDSLIDVVHPGACQRD